MTLTTEPEWKLDSRGDEPEDERNLGGHLVVLVLYGVLVGGIAALSVVTGRQLPRRMSPRDLLLAAVAVHKLSRTITKDEVTNPLRAPFTEYDGDGGPAEVMESPKYRNGARRSLGELLTCPFCFDVWAVAVLTVGRVFAPRPTALCVDALAVLTGADFLHLAYAKAQQVAG
ncbi:DUF1360 domain-containing protein [Rhodococcus sp. NPDC003382]